VNDEDASLIEQRAERAKQILDDPLVIETFAEVEKALLRGAKNIKTPDEAYRGVLALQALDLVIASIRGYIESGKVIEHNFRHKKLGIF